MTGEEIFNKIMLAVQDGENEDCADLARSALEEGIEPLTIVDEGLSAGIRIVGRKFGCGEMFLPDLMMAVEAMKAGMEILQPELDKRKIRKKSRGTVMIGTVFGDIHDIGKSIVATMLEMNGYEVIDLGINISTETFVKKIRELNPNILGLSAMLATTMREQKEVIEAVKKKGSVIESRYWWAVRRCQSSGRKKSAPMVTERMRKWRFNWLKDLPLNRMCG